MHHDDQDARDPGSKDMGTENRGGKQSSWPGGGTGSNRQNEERDRRQSTGNNAGDSSSGPRIGDRNERDRSQRSDSQQ